MKIIFWAFLVVLAIAFTLPTRTFAADAAADYKAMGASCHGAEGKGETAMAKAMKIKDLASDDVQKQSDADLTGIIAKARNPCPPTKAS